MQFTPYIIVLISASAICFLIGLNSLRYRETPVETIYTFAMLLAITEWLLAAAFGYGTTNLDNKIVWAKIEYLGVVSVPLLVLLFSISYSGHANWLTARNLILLALIPVLTLVLAWTNEKHGLIWSSYIPYRENGLALSSKTYGLWFWVYWVYSYLLLFTSIVLIVRHSLGRNIVFKRQAMLLVLGILIPWLGNALYVSHISPLHNLDLTPIFFAFTGTTLSLGMVRWHLFDIRPTAQTLLIENMTDGVILLDRLDRIIDINPAARRIFHINHSGAIGQEAQRVLPQAIFADQGSGSRVKIRTDIKLYVEGKERSYEITSTPLTNARGNMLGRIVIEHDTTELNLINEKLMLSERKLAQAALQESQAKYRLLFENSFDAILLTVPDGRIIAANPAACRMFGRSEQEICQLGRNGVVDLTDLRLFSALEERARTGKYRGELTFVRKDGTRFTGEMTSVIFADSEGNPNTCMTIRDISAQKQTEEALQSSERKYRDLFENAPVPYFSMGTDGLIKESNIAAQQFVGYSKDELTGKPRRELFAPESAEKARLILDKVNAGVHVENEEMIYQKKDGSRVYGLLSSAPILNEEGRVTAVRSVVKDITAIKQAEAKMVEMEALKKINKVKSELLANVSHELRTPLASIKGFIETLIEQDVTWSKEQQLDFLNSANMEADRLTFLIRDLLDMSRIDSGKMVLDKRSYRVEEILSSITGVLSMITVRHKLKINIQPELPPIGVDKVRIGQVITNLIENATKFSPEGSPVVVEVKAKENAIHFSIEDKGEGIAPQALGNLFNRFYQAERVVSGKTRGTGLGLAICKGIVEAHGGQIWAESQLGVGSKFSFSLPASDSKAVK